MLPNFWKLLSVSQHPQKLLFLLAPGVKNSVPTNPGTQKKKKATVNSQAYTIDKREYNCVAVSQSAQEKIK